MNWGGIEIQIDRTSGDIYTMALDARETELPAINSASGVHNVSDIINLYDGNWHNVLYMWSMDDSVSYPSYTDGNGISALRKGVLAVDGFIIGNNGTSPGKQTPFNFIFDWANKLATLISIGAKTQNAGSSAFAASAQNIQPFAGMVQRLVIWDRPLGPDSSTNIHTTLNESPNGFYLGPAGGASIISKSAIIGSPDYSAGFWDPLTGVGLRALSGNVVVYHKYDELTNTSTSATDWAGNAFYTSSSGAQLNPNTGNPLSFLGVEIELGDDYQLQDIPDPNEDGIMKTGLIAFEDSAGVKRNVGFINYDLGFVVLDGEFSGNGITAVPFLQSIGMSGMSTTETQKTNNFYVKSINFTSQEFIESLILNLTSSGFEMNKTENPTGIDLTTGGQLLNPPSTWPHSVGLYNDYNELVGVAKFSSPIRKDEDHNVVSQVKLDFSGTYSKGTAIR